MMTFPIYDERFLPVLYSSIGIFRRLVNCSHVTGQSYHATILRRFILAQGKQHIRGHEQDVAYISPKHPLPLPPPFPPSPIFRHFFRYASGTSHILSPRPETMTTLSRLPLFRHFD